MAADFVNGTDVRVVQGGSSTRLASESFEGLWIAGQFVRKELQGDEAA